MTLLVAAILNVSWFRVGNFFSSLGAVYEQEVNTSYCFLVDLEVF